MTTRKRNTAAQTKVLRLLDDAGKAGLDPKDFTQKVHDRTRVYLGCEGMIEVIPFVGNHRRVVLTKYGRDALVTGTHGW